MKLKHLFFSTLAAMALAACSSEAEEIKPAEKSQETPVATIDVEMSGALTTDGVRALALDFDEDYPPFIHTDNVSWLTHCFIRNEEADAQFYAEIDWIPTTNADGSITLKIKNSSLQLLPTGDLIGLTDSELAAKAPKAGETWYIAGMAGGGVLNDSRTDISFDYNASLDATLPAGHTRLPLQFDWKPFTVSKKSGERAPQIAVQFKPRGSLIHIRLNNKTNPQTTDATVVVSMTTNATTPNISISYALAGKDNLTADPITGWSRPSTAEINSTLITESQGIYFSHEYSTRTRSIVLNSTTNKGSVFLWGFYAKESAEDFITSIYSTTHLLYNAGTKQTPTNITRTFEDGKAYVYHLDVARPLTPIERVAESNLAEGKAAFVSSTTSTSGSHFFTKDEMFNDLTTSRSTKSGQLNIGPRRYTVPNSRLMYGVFTNYSNFKLNTVGIYKNIVEDTRFSTYLDLGGKGTTSDYNIVNSQYAYALRFKGGLGNDYQTAYRYQLITNQSGHERIEVTTRYLGPSFTGTIEEISNETFWSSNTENDATRLFPFTGYYENDVLTQIGSEARAWTIQGDYILQINANRMLTTPIVSTNNKYPVRLMLH